MTRLNFGSNDASFSIYTAAKLNQYISLNSSQESFENCKISALKHMIDNFDMSMSNSENIIKLHF